MLPEMGHLLRIFIGESDQHEGVPLYEWIVRAAKKEGLAGATVLRGLEGFGAHSRVHKARLLSLSADLPIVVEIVDERDKIEAFLPLIDAAIHEGLVTIEKVEIRFYRSGTGQQKGETSS
jgi:PII-like signaling protein